jgi:CspA family cold shock protein
MTGSTTETTSTSGSTRPKRITGTVAWFNNPKGHGFLARDDGEKDVFVHYTGITPKNGRTRRELTNGERVEFEVGTIAGRPQAMNVIVLPAVEEAAAAGA